MNDQPPFDALNAAYAQELFERYSRNPNSVSEEWRSLFSDGGLKARRAGLLLPENMDVDGNGLDASGVRTEVRVETVEVPAAPSLAQLAAVARATALVQAFRDHGHQLSRIDPLGSEPPGHPQLDPGFFGTSMEELDSIPASVVLGRGEDEPLSVTLQRLQDTYCGSIGYQFEHLEDPVRVRWLWDEVESGVHTAPLSAERKVDLLRRLSQVEGLERFLHRAYLGQKRFSIEGNDIMIPMLDLALEEAARQGARKAVIGMAHRGRLNVLTHILGISYEALIGEFEGGAVKEGMMIVPDPGTGDVKYHMGARHPYPLGEGKTIETLLAPNPSHLEFVNPIVSGMVRSFQYPDTDAGTAPDFDSAVPILIHGDAAFAAEGVVAEALNMARLRGYTTGGAIHIICNNQVGFTTDPQDARSTRYASDVAKGYDIPVLHVNADDAEACLAVIRLAMAYREEFHDDIVIDLVGYRRHGHNEGDEPGYTQPALYSVIEKHPTIRKIWADRLVSEKILTEAEAEAIDAEALDRFREAQDRVRQAPEMMERPVDPQDRSFVRDPAVPAEILIEVNEAALAVPDGFAIHPKLQRQLARRRKLDSDSELDWAHAESLAIGSLLRDGVPVRFTGQDVRRGTFSHRHIVLHDATTGEEHTPFNHMGGARIEVFNSPLTETAVMAFEYGYSVAEEKALVLWEGQFGDFANVAQVIIDQFISAGRAKWGQISGLVLLLPHGHEGQGPEHSSARLERFLQLCAEDNFGVAYPTTPAQYYHLLRRHALSRPRRPLVVMTPKSLLRLPLASSRLSELEEGQFLGVIDDSTTEGRRKEIKRVVLSTGKVHYDMVQHEAREAAKEVALVRLEQLYPFPSEELAEVIAGYPGLKEVVWVQEEPRNMGALSFVGPYLRAVVPDSIPLKSISRPDRASPAEGRAKDHNVEQARIAAEALQVGED